jgi:hypothetical protein
MRTKHEEMIEILGASEKDGNFHARIAKYSGDLQEIYQFGVTKAGYNTLKRIFQYKPFDALSQSDYRYFWNYGCGTDDDFYLDIQFEQDRDVKSCPIKADKQLGSNLRWFADIKTASEIKHLKVET